MIPYVINRQPHFIRRTRSVSCAPRYSPRPQRPAFWRCWTRTPVHPPACPPWYLGHLCRSDRQAGRQATISRGWPGGELVHVFTGGPLERRARQSSSRSSGVGAAGRERSVHACTHARRRCGATTAPSFSTSPELLCVELQHALGLLRLRGSALRRSLRLRLLARVLPAPRPAPPTPYECARSCTAALHGRVLASNGSLCARDRPGTATQ
eukprot:COSAG01_NODE_4523_length_4954_cov_116.868795_5_plen_210_part_00